MEYMAVVSVPGWHDQWNTLQLLGSFSYARLGMAMAQGIRYFPLCVFFFLYSYAAQLREIDYL